jgi:MFS family permease
MLTRDAQAEQKLPEAVKRNLPGNALRIIGATALQNSGDQVVKASTVLPWLFHALGVPSALVGLLVPIRESGSMLPQALLTPFVLRVRRRKWVFVVGALVQALMVAAMAVIAAFADGLVAGVLILVALAVFSLGRSLCSIASKDVLGRTVPKGTRGQINGLSTMSAGIVAIALGFLLRVVGGGEPPIWMLVVLLAGGSVMWVLAALVYSTVREPVRDDADTVAGDDHTSSEPPAISGGLKTAVRLLRDDVPFRRFVIMRSLLLVSALSPPFVITLAVSTGAGALSGLGGFIIASGLSAVIGGPVFGRVADRASRNLMAAGAGLASVTLVLMLVLSGLPTFDGGTVWGAAVFVTTYFLLTLVHTGVRVGRKTYIVDMAKGDQRTNYVAVSNSAMGIILLAAGGISSLLALWGVQWAIAFLAALGFLGVIVAARLPDVSAG